MTPAAIHCGRAPEVRAARYDPAPPHTDDPEMWMRAASVRDASGIGKRYRARQRRASSRRVRIRSMRSSHNGPASLRLS